MPFGVKWCLQRKKIHQHVFLSPERTDCRPIGHLHDLWFFVFISRERGTAMYYCLQAYWLAKVRPNQTEEAGARLAVSLDRLQNIEEVVLATRIGVWE